MGCCELLLVACCGWPCCPGVCDAGACAKIIAAIPAISKPMLYAAGLFIRMVLRVSRQTILFAGFGRLHNSQQDARRAVDALGRFLKVRVFGAVDVHKT